MAKPDHGIKEIADAAGRQLARLARLECSRWGVSPHGAARFRLADGPGPLEMDHPIRGDAQTLGRQMPIR